MTKEEFERKLAEELVRLDKAADELIRTSGYVKDARRLRTLAEMIREQIRHENIMSANSQTR